MCFVSGSVCLGSVCDIVWNFRSLEGFESENTSQALLSAFEFWKQNKIKIVFKVFRLARVTAALQLPG